MPSTLRAKRQARDEVTKLRKQQDEIANQTEMAAKAPFHGSGAFLKQR